MGGTHRDNGGSAVRRRAGRIVRWMSRSGHRVAITAGLQEDVRGLTGTVLDIGGGRDSPLAGAWSPTTERVRLDIVHDHLPALQGDACQLPIRDASVDGVVISEVLEHVPEPAAALAELARVLRPGAPVVGSVPFLGQVIHADPHDYHRFTGQALRHLLRDLDDVVVTPHGNGFGASWRLLSRGRRWLLPLNPLMRRLSRRTDPLCPEGYTFTARRALEPADRGASRPPRS